MEDLDIIGTMFGTEESSSRHDYLRHYGNLFARFRREQFNFIEIGVFNHASLATWRCYFESANIIGLDSRDHDSCKAEDGIVVEVGSLGVFTAALEGVTHPVIRIGSWPGSLSIRVASDRKLSTIRGRPPSKPHSSHALGQPIGTGPWDKPVGPAPVKPAMAGKSRCSHSNANARHRNRTSHPLQSGAKSGPCPYW